jgi:hypothetical protein
MMTRSSLWGCCPAGDASVAQHVVKMQTHLGLTPDEVYSNWGMLAQSGLIAWDKVETITTLAALKELIAKEMSANGELGRRCRVGDENRDDDDG